MEMVAHASRQQHACFCIKTYLSGAALPTEQCSGIERLQLPSPGLLPRLSPASFIHPLAGNVSFSEALEQNWQINGRRSKYVAQAVPRAAVSGRLHSTCARLMMDGKQKSLCQVRAFTGSCAHLAVARNLSALCAPYASARSWTERSVNWGAGPGTYADARRTSCPGSCCPRSNGISRLPRQTRCHSSASRCSLQTSSGSPRMQDFSVFILPNRATRIRYQTRSGGQADCTIPAGRSSAKCLIYFVSEEIGSQKFEGTEHVIISGFKATLGRQAGKLAGQPGAAAPPVDPVSTVANFTAPLH